MNTIEILQGSREVLIGEGRNVTIREMSWLDLKKFLATLAEQASRFTDENGKLKLDMAALLQAIQESESLSEQLLTRTTDLGMNDLGDLRVGEFLSLVDASLELNVSVITNLAKKIGGRLIKIAGGAVPPVPMTPMPPLPPSSTS